MADKSIDQLQAADSILATDLFVLQQNNLAKKLPGQILLNWLTAAADGHGGIQSISKISTSGLKDTYRITLADTTIFDFVVTNGRAITSVSQTDANGLTRTYTIAFNDNTSESFKVVDGRAISSIEETNVNGLTRTYTILFNDLSSETFTVTDGRSITNFQKVSTSGLEDTYKLTYNDGTSNTITVTNGAKGDKGDNVYLWIKYASQEPTEASHSFGDLPDDWIGIYSGTLSGPPVDWQDYSWFKIKGEQGDTGNPATLVTKSVTYQVSDSGTITPSGAWGSSIPVVSQGKYLWTKTEVQFNTGDPIVSYSVARMGIDGTGSVSSVAGVSPDATGNVTLTAADVGALPSSGGDMTGAINMNGQPISGLNDPTEDTQAARKGYVDASARKAAPRNLLDNSDFANPVNQRGFVSGSEVVSGAYFIDRWHADWSAPQNPILNENGLSGLNNGTIEQKVDLSEYIGKPITIAIYEEYNKPIACGSGTVIESESWAAIAFAPNWECRVYSSNRHWYVGVEVECKYIALYLGEYTIDTLPDYQPKGYGAELAECQRYYQIRSANNIAAVDMRPTMRLSSPTITSVTGGYAYSADL